MSILNENKKKSQKSRSIKYKFQVPIILVFSLPALCNARKEWLHEEKVEHQTYYN